MTYILSDIHGNLRRFESIMKQINLQPDDTLYVLGDVIDRYPDGIKILRRIMKMPNAKMLIGNHEYMMLKSIGHCKDAAEEKENTNWRQRSLWYRNGGMFTHEQLKHYQKSMIASVTVRLWILTIIFFFCNLNRRLLFYPVYKPTDGCFFIQFTNLYTSSANAQTTLTPTPSYTSFTAASSVCS